MSDVVLKNVTKVSDKEVVAVKGANLEVKDVLQRRIEATDRQIDALVYELYGLTD